MGSADVAMASYVRIWRGERQMPPWLLSCLGIDNFENFFQNWF
jgi:hypothetical protein